MANINSNIARLNRVATLGVDSVKVLTKPYQVTIIFKISWYSAPVQIGNIGRTRDNGIDHAAATNINMTPLVATVKRKLARRRRYFLHDKFRIETNSLAVDIEPNEWIHLYAPGAEAMGYRVIGLTIDPVPHIRFEPVEFPASEIYHFEPLDERVPVYQQPFTLLQEAVVSGEPEAEEALKELDAVTLSGTLNYQACDDKLCFDPVAVPLSFTLDVETLDRQRANR
mgnify:CR=1 FL=1